jgi:transposase InsO family protein
MTLDERNKYLRLMRPRYLGATTRAAKGALLDEMQTVTGLNRNYLIQKLKHPIRRQPRSRERGRRYGPQVAAALAQIARAQDHICPTRLHGYLLETAENLARHGALRLDPHLRAKLATISVSSVRRHLPPADGAVAHPTPRPRPNTLQQEIPIRVIPWDTMEPGHCEVDLVHHGGPDPRGQYGYTLQMVDVATGWSGRRAVLGRSYVVVADAFYALFAEFPFAIRELHVDNGGEFLSHLLQRFLRQFYPTVARSRSEPGQPTHNRFVEQKNDTLVRSFVGDWRLDTVAQIRYLNTLYTMMSRYYNLWQPVMHQVAKERIPTTADRPAYTRRVHDRPRPPLERLCETGDLTPAQEQALRAQQQAIDLLALREEIHTRLPHLFTYPAADPDQVENAFETLAYPELFPAAFAALDVIPTDGYHERLSSYGEANVGPLPTLRKEQVSSA